MMRWENMMRWAFDVSVMYRDGTNNWQNASRRKVPMITEAMISSAGVSFLINADFADAGQRSSVIGAREYVYAMRGLATGLIRSSIGLEIVLVIDAQRGVLIFLAGDAVAGDEEVDVGAHEAAEGILRGADNWLAPDVEAGVYQNRAAGPRLESREQRVIARVGVLVHS